MKVLLGSAAAVALLAFGGAAQAQTLGDILDNATGNWANISVNVATIDGSVGVDVGDTVTGSLGDISTTAVGAVNDGIIAADGVRDVLSVEGHLDYVGLELTNNLDAIGAAGPSDTGFAAVSDDLEANLDVLHVDLDLFAGRFGPMEGVNAVNAAFNSAPIDGSVMVEAGGDLANIGSVSTVVAGAVNTGVISMGFDTLSLN